MILSTFFRPVAGTRNAHPGARARAAAALLAIATLALTPGHAAAQRREPGTRVWAGGGFGGSTGPAHVALTDFIGQLVLQHRSHYLALRALAGADLANFPDGSDDGHVELSALYGRALSVSHAHVALATGLAYADLNPCPGRLPPTPYAPRPDCSTIGVPVVAELGIQPLPVIGVVLQGYGNFNPRKSFFGLAGLIQLGWMR